MKIRAAQVKALRQALADNPIPGPYPVVHHKLAGFDNAAPIEQIAATARLISRFTPEIVAAALDQVQDMRAERRDAIAGLQWMVDKAQGRFAVPAQITDFLASVTAAEAEDATDDASA